MNEIDLHTAEIMFERAINNKHAIKQKRAYIKDIIADAKPNSSMALVFHQQSDLILMQKAFTNGLKKKAAAKNFTLEFSLHSA